MATIHLQASGDTWWRQSQQDLRAAEHLLQGGFARHAAVMAHLAVEKALKAAYRAQHSEAPPVSHDVAYLADQLTWPEAMPYDHARSLDALARHGVVALYSDQAFGAGVPSDRDEARARVADAHHLIETLGRMT
ncbi:MAG: HEPN domain-containing protein [Longimonas sp.]|uniref:HEPN domain-containing protein n=1 Tax=Longimonas sp. TaxID=2039626 RepID=UPI003358AD1C